MHFGHGTKIRVREIFDLMGLALRLQYMSLMIDVQQRWKDQYRDEQRWRTMGMIGTVVVVVIHTWPEFDDESGDELGRIISARKATKTRKRNLSNAR